MQQLSGRLRDSVLAPGEHAIRDQRQHWFGLVVRWEKTVVASSPRSSALARWLPEPRRVPGHGPPVPGTRDRHRRRPRAAAGGLGVPAVGQRPGRPHEPSDRAGRGRRQQASRGQLAGEDQRRRSYPGHRRPAVGFGDLDVLTAAEMTISKSAFLKDSVGFKKDMLNAKHELELELSGGGPARRHHSGRRRPSRCRRRPQRPPRLRRYRRARRPGRRPRSMPRTSPRRWLAWRTCGTGHHPPAEFEQKKAEL